jgi:hypothetical protein
MAFDVVSEVRHFIGAIVDRKGALSRSRVLLVNREVGPKAESRKINDLVNLKSRQIPSKIAYSWPV